MQVTRFNVDEVVEKYAASSTNEKEGLIENLLSHHPMHTMMEAMLVKQAQTGMPVDEAYIRCCAEANTKA